MTDAARLIPASASVYAETRFFDCTAVRSLAVVDSITVTTVMLRTTVTPNASTSANPRSSDLSRFRIRFTVPLSLDAGAVPQVDRVLESVEARHRVSVDTGDERHADRRETAATGDVREADERRRGGQIFRDADGGARRAARRSRLAVEIPARGRARLLSGAP